MSLADMRGVSGKERLRIALTTQQMHTESFASTMRGLFALPVSGKAQVDLVRYHPSLDFSDRRDLSDGRRSLKNGSYLLQ